MLTLDPHIQARSAATRPLPLQARRDLEIRQIGAAPHVRWVVKDPISLRYYHLNHKEYFLLQRLDGRRSQEELRREYAEQFPAASLSTAQLQSFLTYLHENGLITSPRTEEAAALLERRDRMRRRQRLAAIANPLAIRFPGVDPGRFLNWLYPRCRWMFSPAFLAFCGTVIMAALLLVTVQFRTLQTRLPEFQTFFTPTNLLWLMAAVAAAKVLHELAHALACRHFGGQCHEIGLMFLVFTPCLYCDVTDAWMLPRRRQRIAISAAGMFAEMVLAAVCAFLWWFSQPGFLNSLCLNQMVVCSVTTLLFNANPLLRYDGYYILSDLVNVPNLRQRSGRALQALCARLFLGTELPRSEITAVGREAWLVTYALLSGLYKLFILAAILWFYFELLEPYQLQIVPQLLAGFTLIGLVLIPAFNTAKWFGQMAAAGYIHWLKFITRSVITVAIVGTLLFVPLPCGVSATAMLEPLEGRRLYVTTPGTLQMILPDGAEVKDGELVAQLRNTEIDVELAQIEGELRLERRKLENLQKRRITEPDVDAMIPAVQERVRDLEGQAAQRRTDAESLKIFAPRSGQIFAVPHTTATNEQELPTWSGSLHDPRNLGCFLEAGAQICVIGDADRGEALLLIDQADIAAVKAGQAVKLYFGGLVQHRVAGTIAEVAATDLEQLPPLLAKQLQVPTRSGNDQAADPAETVYLARVPLSGEQTRIVAGAAGVARIEVAPQSLAQRLATYLARTFRLGH